MASTPSKASAGEQRAAAILAVVRQIPRGRVTTYGIVAARAVLSLFRDDPNQINSLLTPFEAVTNEQIKTAARKYLVATNRTVINRVPEAKPQTTGGNEK